MEVIRIGCELSNQCRNYKIECGNCSQNWEIDSDIRMDYEDYSEECSGCGLDCKCCSEDCIDRMEEYLG